MRAPFCFLQFAFLIGLTLLPSLASADGHILVNRPESPFDTRYDYPHTLLQRVLDVTATEESSDQVKPARHVMSRNRLLIELSKGDEVHVVAEAPKPDWLEQLRVIRIPIRKGLQGYRLFLINRSDQARISGIDSLKEFVKLPTGSDAEWSTTRVMRDAGFDVVTGSSYEGLFAMLEKRRFLTFGRGINEIENELRSHEDEYPELAIESDIALHIPLPTYFFVTPTQPGLAKRIQSGLELLIANGEFEKLFQKYHMELIEKFRLKDRKIFSIPNTNLSKEDPVDNHSLWYRL